MEHREWVVYLVKCSDGSLYCGVTTNLKNRLLMHNSGKGSKYTRSRRPVELVGSSFEMSKSDALKLENQIKKLPASKKLSVLRKLAKRLTKNTSSVRQKEILANISVYADSVGIVRVAKHIKDIFNRSCRFEI